MMKRAISKTLLFSLNEDNSFSVKLPAENMIDYANRITVTVLDKDGAPLKDISVTVSDAEKSMTDTTNADGKIIVPPMSEDYTDNDGIAKVGSYTILVENVKAKIENAYITLNADGTISVLLPENIKIEHSNRITVTVLDKDNKGVKDISVTVKETVSENAENENAAGSKTATDVTDKDGKNLYPPEQARTLPIKTAKQIFPKPYRARTQTATENPIWRK